MQGFAPLVRLGSVAWLHRYQYWLISCITVLLLLLPNYLSGVQAQATYPPFLDPHLNDYGRVIEPTDAAIIRSTLTQFQQQTGIQAVVVTVNSVQDYRTGDRTIESFATNLFNTWGIGDRTRNDGILLLVAPGDRKVRIELGQGYAVSYDSVAQSIIDDTILPSFREGLISQGTVSGVNAITNRFRSTTAPSDGLGIGDIPQAFRTVPSSDGGMVALIGGGVALIAGVPVFSHWRRYRKRQCPRCNTEMTRLDEQADDQFLNAGQRKEESLGSVDYDAWQCSSCGYHQVLQHGNLFSRYRRCPSCSTKALDVKTTTIRHATYSHGGEEKIDETCRHCSYHNTHYRYTPRLERPSSNGSSSGGSGGGGKSSGGGASGSW